MLEFLFRGFFFQLGRFLLGRFEVLAFFRARLLLFAAAARRRLLRVFL